MKYIDETSGIWDIAVTKKRAVHDPVLVARISMLYQPKLVADLGCADGWYCKMLKAFGWPAPHGYEGTPGVSELGIYDDIMTVDLSKRRYAGIDYDFVLCLEVGEHIPEGKEQIFIDNVCTYAQKHLVLSWAIPGQKGKGHFNEQPNSYVISEFMKRGFSFHKKKSHKLRKFTTRKWFRNTLMIFERE